LVRDLDLDFRPPYNWPRLLEFLAPRATPGVEAVHDNRYLRTIRVGATHGFLEVRLEQAKSALAVRLQLDDPSSLQPITANSC
jgi:DNA-3-methyladenine glycosylase II